MFLTEVLKPSTCNKIELLNDPVILKAVNILKNNGIIGMPTETVYGLAACGYSIEAIKKIYTAKSRPPDNPLIYHIAELDSLYDITENVPEIAFRLAGRFWPGPLTMIFQKKSIIPDQATCGLDTVAVRMPDNDIALSLIKLCGFPLAAPSANISGSPSPTSAFHVLNDLNGKIPLIIDGGDCACGLESTVVIFERDNDLEKIRVLRPGAVTLEMLSEYAEIITDKSVEGKLSDNNKPISPGTKYKHYSPKAKVILINTSDLSRFNEYVSNQIKNNLKKNVFALVYDLIDTPECAYAVYGKTGQEQARLLFAKLRELDEAGADIIFVRTPEKNGIGFAVYNRLLRAADFNVIYI